MAKILVNSDNVIVSIADDAVFLENGILSNGVIYGDKTLNVFDVVVPLDVEIQKHKYTPTTGFVVNTNYVKPYIPELAQKETDERLLLVEQAMLAMLGV